MLLLATAGSARAFAGPVAFADLARHPQYAQVELSPDGRYVASLSVIGGRTDLSVIRIADHKGFNLETHDRGDVTAFWWVSPTRIIYTEGVRDSNFDAPLADGQLFAVNADGRGRALLYGYGSNNPYWGPAQQLISTLPNDPNHVLVSVERADGSSEDGGMPVVERMDVTSGRMSKVMDGPAEHVQFLADHAGNIRFAFGVDDEDHAIVYSHPPGKGGWQAMSAAEAARDFPIAFDATDKAVYFSCSVASGFGVCTWDPATRKMTTVWTNPHVVANGLTEGPARDQFLGVDFEDGRPGVALFDPHSAGARLLVGLMQQFPGQLVQFVSSTRDGSRSIVLVSSDTDPGTYYLYEHATNTAVALLRPAPWINPQEMATKQPFEFKARDGLELHGYVSYPPGMEGAKHLPMVVYVHGGPYGIRDWWDYEPDVQAVATRGYAVLQVNFRGSGGYGHAFEKAGWMQWGAKMQDDVTDATRWAIAQGIADRNRICIYGASYGGYAALEGAIQEPDLYKCAIGYVGVYDLDMLYRRGDISESHDGRDYLRRVLGDDTAELAARSPAHQAGRLKASVMLIVGGQDTRVPPAQGREMLHALRAQHHDVTWVYQRKEAHGFYDEANVADLYEKIDGFIGRSIGPGAVVVHAPPGQAATH
ncbi:MAG TPA: S9 family peptidase [Rhodanobacteraceae bacterium]|nr:S9 family peptidase [Rhodanobacteraceae bacterium]